MDEQQASDIELKWDLLVADAWDDPALKQRLLDDPKGVLKERGINVPDGIDVKVLENSDSVEHFVLPAGPMESELSEEELEAVAGGACRGGGGGGRHSRSSRSSRSSRHSSSSRHSRHSSSCRVCYFCW